MSYRNLPRTLANIEAAGLNEIAQRVINGVQRARVIPWSMDIQFDDPKQTRRAHRLLYEFLYFYPKEKARISLRVNGTVLRIKFTDKMETRGRRGIK